MNQIRWMSLGIVLTVSLFAIADDKPAANPLVTVAEGKLPIIISAPHGGANPIEGVPERKGEGIPHKPGKFVTSRDTGTEELAGMIADAIEARMKKRPYMVVAKFHRKYCDANRSATEGYEDPKAKPVYDAYHGTLLHYCEEVRKKYGSGLVLDVHAQSSGKDTIYRGTQNGKTVSLLTQRFGPGAHVGPKSLLGFLAAEGCKVYPTDDGKEQAGFTGGYISQTYGTPATGLDAIQLEFGTQYRTKEKMKETAEKVAKAVEEFSKLYLTLEEKK